MYAIAMGFGRFSLPDSISTALWPYRGLLDDIPEGVNPFVVQIVILALLAPLVFRALPETLRRANVQRRHIARATAYSLVPLPLVLAVCVGATRIPAHIHDSLARSALTAGQLRYHGPRFLTHLIALVTEYEGPMLCGLAGVWLWWWWSITARLYLKLPHSVGVALAMVVIAELCSVFALFLIVEPLLALPYLLGRR
jgi:hypothetical protein